jgi:hypothetical protein
MNFDVKPIFNSDKFAWSIKSEKIIGLSKLRKNQANKEPFLWPSPRD